MKTEQKILFVVDDNNASLAVCKNILKTHYTVYPAPSAAKMFGLLERIIPDMILMDVDMPEMNGYEAVGRMKKNDTYKNIPVIFISGRVDPASEIFGLNMGALDYIHKPFAAELLLKRIKTNLSLIESRETLEERNRSGEKLLARILEISSPLNSIIETLEAAIIEEDKDKLKSSISKANTTAKYLMAHVKRIFDISKTEAEKNEFDTGN